MNVPPLVPVPWGWGPTASGGMPGGQGPAVRNMP